ncbi:MAG: fasciclin domain-containing protein [Bacteroidetes bacterium]|nr:fasciclin domain-containing protein [Bacteroidota bacterium]
MKKIFYSLMFAAALSSCNNPTEESTAPTEGTSEEVVGQSAVQDDQSQKDVVKVAVGSPDHTTLVAAVKAAEYVDVLSNAGPFTVFAPTNAAFDKLPAGTVDGLLKPEAKNDLRNILEYHVTTSSFKEEYLKDGMTIGMVNGGSVKVSKGEDGKIKINDANVLGAVPASNGMVYVLDAVLLPAAK